MKKRVSSLRLRFAHIFALLVVCVPVLRASDPFTKITGDAIVSSGASSSLAWGDYNNDGFIDLYVNVVSPGTSLLYSNRGNGTFSRVMTGSIATDVGTSFGAAWADYDNDGFLDLFVARNSQGNDWLYHNEGDGTFTKITAGAIVNSAGNGNNCTWGDYDKDGFVDLFVANSDQRDFLYRNRGDGTFVRITNGVIAEKPGNSQGGMWGDYDNDGWPDLFVSRGTPPSLLYHNDGNGHFTEITNGPISTDMTVGQGDSWGDYDNDGYLDMFLANPFTGAKNFLYHNKGDGTFTKITNGVVVNDTHGSSTGVWGDYDNDGDLDLFVANRGNGNYLYRNNGDGTFSRVNDSIVATDPSNSFAAAWGDYDNDGFLDLFVSNPFTYNNFLYRNNRNSNGWIALRCEGRTSNRAAIGTKVRVKATIAGKVTWQLREISGGGALGSQNDLRAHFGLGDATNVEVVRIEWPSGILQEFTNIAVNQLLNVIESSVTIHPIQQEVVSGADATFTLSTSLAPPLLYQWRLDEMDLPARTNATLVVSNVQAADLGHYTVVVTSLVTSNSVVSPPARLTGACVITRQPFAQGVRRGSNVTLSASVTGAGAISHQWSFNDTTLLDATNAFLTLTNIQLSHEGSYSLRVSNSFGAVTSDVIKITVLVTPIFTQQPQSARIVAGEEVTFSVAATGHPLPFGFRWRRNGVGFTNFVLNQTNCSLTLLNVQTNQAGNYTAIVTNAATIGVVSAVALLTVLPDSDGDHLPDEWETAHGLNPTNALDAEWDDDADGLSNGREYVAGTDPHDAQSSLRIEARRSENEANGLLLRFPAISNKVYAIEFRASALAGSWTKLVDVGAASTNRSIEMADPASLEGSNQRFYRVVMPRVP